MSKFYVFLVFWGLSFGVAAQQVLIRGEVLSFEPSGFAQAQPQDDGSWSYCYAHFTQIPTAAQRSRLEDLGVQFLAYWPDNVYLVALSRPIKAEKSLDFGMDGLITVSPASKLSQKIKERPIPDWAQAKGGRVKIIVKGYSTISGAVFRKLFERHGQRIDFASHHSAYVELTVSEEEIGAISEWPEVAFVDWVTPKGMAEDNVGRAMHRANILDANYAGGRHYDGTGVSVLVRDDGSVGPHIDFKGRLNQADPTIFGGYDHGDMVAGILGGAGNLEPTYKGMATGAKIYVRDYVSSFDDYTLDLHLNENVVVTNSSYGNGCNAGYTASTHTVDQQIYEHPTLMHVFSAGNHGSSNCSYGAGAGWGNITGGHKQGKNVMASGNLNSDISLISSSSRGPAYDGRIKPDLCAFGQGQMATDPNNIYNLGGGTSAASPGVAGVFVQLIQAYKELNGGEEPESALIKACMLNTAIDLGNPGPDFKYGWGEVNGYRAVKLLEEHHYTKNSIDQGQTKSSTIAIAANQSQVRFMLYWADPPAMEGASKALINNLDLKVITPAGDTILPWVLDATPNAAKLALPAVHGVDDLNNMEQVSFQTPVAGDYTILVEGKTVPMGPQSYYVLYSVVDTPLFMASPIGGESYHSKDTIRVFWDAYGVPGPYTLDVSYDGGGSWTNLASTTAKSFVWPIPDTVTAKAQMRVSSGGFVGQSQSNFSIMNRPSELVLDSLCPHQGYFSWKSVPGATGYDFYRLGDQYMEIVGSAADTFIELPIINPLEDFWYSVRAKGADGLHSERTYAKYYVGGISGCVLHRDLSVVNLETSNDSVLFLCSSTKLLPIQAKIQNNGIDTISNVVIKYRKNGGIPSVESLSAPIAPGEIVLWTAHDSLLLDTAGEYSLSVLVISANDEIPFNDTLVQVFSVVDLTAQAQDVLDEGFEGVDFLPENWSQSGEIGDYAWKRKKLIGIGNDSTECASVDNYNIGLEDKKVILRSPAVWVSNSRQMYLSFDYSYAPYDEINADSLKVSLVDLCSLGEASVLFFKGGEDLRTVNHNSTEAWVPTAGTDWKHEVFPITVEGDGLRSVEFENINEYGNWIYLDNIQLVAGILGPETTCVNDTITLTTDIPDSGQEFVWDFGNGEEGTTAAPKQVVYDTPGSKTVRLMVKQNGIVDTFSFVLTVDSMLEAGFMVSVDGQEVSFSNQSVQAVTYLWDFGDGTSSEEENPVHVYTDGLLTHTVCLMATNVCGQIDTSCVQVQLVGNESVNPSYEGIVLAPNPTSDLVYLTNRSSQKYEFQLSLLDVTGRVVQERREAELVPGGKYELDVSGLSGGVYWVRLLGDRGVGTFRILVGR